MNGDESISNAEINSNLNTMQNTETINGGKPKTSEKLWSPSFLLLWQGQLVSVLGDAVYGLALGFWVLAVTGSTALMGTLMAASTLPSVLVSPFAGVIVDRTDRKKMLILMDLIRGITILLLAIAAYQNALQIWMVFAAGVILSVGGAFFSPAVGSSIPDIVPQSKLVGANSVMGMLGTGSNIVGSSAGGYLLQVLGAPFLFLFNGLSFIFSAFLNIFIKIPKIERKNEQHFFADMRDGYKFIWHFKALRYLLFVSSAVNFIFFIAMVLFLPLFQKTESLGPGKYGVVMSFFTGGMFVAMAITSLIKIPPNKRMTIFMFGAMFMTIFFGLFALTDIFVLMAALIFGGGFCMAIVNVFVNSTIQLTVPQEIRGKVFSLISMVCMSLTPFAMAIGGALGEWFPLRSIIFTCFVILFFGFIPLVFVKTFKRFVNFNPEKETLEDIM